MTRQILFADYLVDLETRELVRRVDQTRVHLSPKALELLIVLVTERPKALAKRVLHERLWPETFVSDATLASLVSELREALDDHGPTARLIRTVHRFGYAFAAEAREEVKAAITPIVNWLICDGREQPLPEGEHVIGRDAAASVPLCAPGVSRRHARIVVNAGAAVLSDLGSTNGTQVRGTSVTSPVQLADGDEIRIGSFRLTFRTISDAGTTQPL